jgi:hypothetical protein
MSKRLYGTTTLRYGKIPRPPTAPQKKEGADLNNSLQITIIIIIIIIIIWPYSPLWVFVFSSKSLQVLLSLAVSFQDLTFSCF